MTRHYSDGGPAFPVTDSLSVHATGMSLRDAFAYGAMQSILATPILQDSLLANIAQRAYDMADAMLAQRRPL